MTHDRIADDNYATPVEVARWAVAHALDLLGVATNTPADMAGMEPACGDTAPFGLAMAQRGLRVLLQDRRPVRPEAIGLLWAREHGYAGTIPGDRIELRTGADFLGAFPNRTFRLVATNPPYRDAEAFVRTALRCCLSPDGVAVFLLRLGFLESQGRVALFQERPPAEVHVLTARPSFAHGRTDSTAYGLFFWLGDDLDRLRRAMAVAPRLGWIDNGSWAPRRGRVRVEKGGPHGTSAAAV